MTLLGVSEARELPDARIAGRGAIDHPRFHPHALQQDIAKPREEVALLVFVQDAARRKIDEVHQ